jgi:hypothetical protein
MYQTLEAAKQAGFRPTKDWQYGGEQIELKGHRLAREPKEAISRPEWCRRGYRVKFDAEPHAYCTNSVVGGWATYPVFRDDQVDLKHECKAAPAPPRLIPILKAVWGLSRRAIICHRQAWKKDEDGLEWSASRLYDEKVELDALRGQALHWLVQDGTLSRGGFQGDWGGNYSEALEGGGFTFLRPCPPQPHQDRLAVEKCFERPCRSCNPRLADCRHTVEAFLAGRPYVEVYEWRALETDWFEEIKPWYFYEAGFHHHSWSFE